MLRVALKSLWARKFRLVSTSIAVMLGVAFMAGTLVLNATLGGVFEDMFATAYKYTDVDVRGKVAVRDDFGNDDQRYPVDAALLDKVAHVDGVKEAHPFIMAYAQLVGKDGKFVNANGAPNFGGIWTQTDTGIWKMTSGRAPKADSEVVIDAASARRGKFKVGDTADVVTAKERVKVTIVGIASWGQAESAAGSAWTVFTVERGKQLLSQGNTFTGIEVQAAKGVSQTELRDRIAKVLPENAEAITGKKAQDESVNSLKKQLAPLTIFLLVFAGIALFVGVFIIYNTFSILVAQRTRETALMRAIGANKSQIVWAIVIEAIGVGALAGLLGLAAGIGIAAGIKAILKALDAGLPGDGVIVTLSTVIWSVVVGVVACVVSSLLPARRASRVPPVAAMREVSIDRSSTSKARMFFGATILAIGVGLILVGLLAGLDKPYIYVGAGAAITFLAVATLGPIFVVPVTLVIGWPIAHLRGTHGKLAVKNAERNPKRTSATAAALMVGVGLVGFILIVGSSVRASVEEVVTRTLSADFYLVDPNSQRPTEAASGIGLNNEVVTRLQASKSLAGVTPFGVGLFELNGKTQMLGATDLEQLQKMLDAQVKEGSLKDFGPNDIALLKSIADENNWHVGSKIPATFQKSGKTELTVKAIYGNREVLGNVVMDSVGYRANYESPAYSSILIAKAKNASVQKARADIDAVAKDYPNVKVSDVTEYKRELNKQIDQMLMIFVGLLALSIIIGLIGIANALLLSIHERTRELGLLRAIGMTRRQLRGAVGWESVIIALFGTLLGLVVAIFFGYAIVHAMKDEGVSVFSIPYMNLMIIALVAAISGSFAAVWPAIRASKLNVLKAIAEE